MNRTHRLQRELPGGLKDRAAELADLPTAQVDLIVSALRASHRAGRDHEADMRKRQRKTRRYDADQVGEAAGRMLGGMGKRSTDGDLEAAAVLYDLIEHQGKRLLDMAVEGLRARGYSDPEIAEGLGITRQAVGQRWGRKRAFTARPVSGTSRTAGNPEVSRDL